MCLNKFWIGKFEVTQQQWEYADRSGGNDIDRVVWYTGDNKNPAHAVDTKSPNGPGFYNMSGNV